jgi:RNA polymerase sigma factor (sigma-70 family)
MMARAPSTSILAHLRRLLDGQIAEPVSDGQLLHWFASNQDEAAFTALMRRHGPMVLATCRRVLQAPHDAEDVFQATFFLLARKASSLRRPDSLGGWLHGVAHRLAVRTKANAERHRAQEEQVVIKGPAEPGIEAAWRELLGVLDEEVQSLPERLRSPLVLCYLEEQTQERAAQALGLPRRTLQRRLAHARELLRTRLTRRGLGLPSAVLGTILAVNTASAKVPSIGIPGWINCPTVATRTRSPTRGASWPAGASCCTCCNWAVAARERKRGQDSFENMGSLEASPVLFSPALFSPAWSWRSWVLPPNPPCAKP